MRKGVFRALVKDQALNPPALFFRILPVFIYESLLLLYNEEEVIL